MSHDPDDKKWLRLGEVAELLSLSTQAARDFLTRHRVRVRRTSGGQRHVDIHSLQQVLEVLDDLR